MSFNYANMMKQAKIMQKKLKEMQEEIKVMEFEASAGGGPFFPERSSPSLIFTAAFCIVRDAQSQTGERR